MNEYKVAIIGSGPSAFYAAQALFKSEMLIKVDMFEKLPTPFGLLRAGVAPDHQQMKTISKSYEKIAANENYRFFGNVTIGSDIKISQLESFYHAIIIATGTENDRKMNITGETIKGSHTATEFVAWYNGHPNYQDRTFDLSGENAIIIGQGNVAVDVTRILAKSTEELKETDITDTALEKLKESKIKKIYMVGRRGPAQAAFTELELKELGNIENVTVLLDNYDLSEIDKEEIENSNKKRKNINLINEYAKNKDNNSKKVITIQFLSSPVEIIEENSKVKKIKFVKNKLEGTADNQKASPTDEFIEIDCDIIFRSIGYQGIKLNGIPFDDKKCVIPNIEGQIISETGERIPNLFVTGWIKRGPSGVIGTNRSDSIETVSHCLKMLENESKLITNDITEFLEENKLRYITYDQWKVIDRYEIESGEKIGKPREKVTSLKKIFDILDS